jgi:hypothetical protein
MNKTFAVMAALALLCLSSLAQAEPITCTFTGDGWGTLAGTAFPDSDFTITAVADTANVEYYGQSNAYDVVNSSASITIQGLGTYTFLPGRGGQAITDTENAVNLGLIAFGVGDARFQIRGVQSDSWDMLTSFGPVVSETGYLMDWSDVQAPGYPVETSGGALVFVASDYGPATFSATVVPEPSSIIALLGGLVGFLGIRRRRE